MILLRNVFQAKPGRAHELAQMMAEGTRRRPNPAGGPRAWRVLTDLTGPFDTVVLEVELESVAEWEQGRRAMFASPEFQADFARNAELIVSGRNELYTIEDRA